MTPSHDAEWWLHKPDLVHLALALGIGGFLGAVKSGFSWTLIVAVVAAAPMAFVTSLLISTLRASAFLRAHGVPSEFQRLVLRPGFLPRFGGTITIILVIAGMASLFR